jgi:hypothetical protein
MKTAKIQNITKPAPQGQKIVERIVARQIHRQKEDLRKWEAALSAAENVHRPDRNQLQRQYTSLMIRRDCCQESQGFKVPCLKC